MNNDNVSLTKREARAIARLLCLLIEHLEVAIDCVMLPGTHEIDPECPDDAAQVKEDRRALKAAERAIAKLTEERRG